MAAKRFHDEARDDVDQPNGKRMRRRPSFASVIGEVIMTNFLHNFCSTLEPMLRKVVNEEVENGLRRGARSLSRAASLRIQSPQERSNLKLKFTKKLSLPIFTGSKILDTDNNPLRIVLEDTTTGSNQWIHTRISHLIKIELVVLDGDFPSSDGDTWTSVEFEKNIIRERTGKRPLLTGDTQVNLKDGFVTIGDIEFTDNSSWIRSRRFRLGARVVQNGANLCEAITEAFVVKDHRGELYRKHHPPMLEDEVWRLEKIGKDGAFHKKLSSAGINTVQDFLKLHVVEPQKLRKVLGVGMSDRMWEVTVKHAKTCVMGNKLYVFRGSNHILFLNPICQVVKAVMNGEIYSPRDSTNINRGYLENMVSNAFANWSTLDEIDGYANETPLLTQGDIVDQYPNTHHSVVRSYQQHPFLINGSTDIVASLPNAEYSNEWAFNSTIFFDGTNSEPSSDSDQTPVRSFFNGRS